ncbi:ATP-binding cassette domain-containing protein [Sinomonas atrocyanea]|uniref:ATP-binding cassette domain-containing protein n=1 Tax=Sinomonas atrocyanea TaxID=37927 RepID=UPI00278124AA|nr:ATP-binding cassette domain-containing protein [Sinomonas atrocyanea]MDQ0259534.1 ABC-type branched-subunit amino acid transport system ATPase component [Sinomonas atrocyanea]MDR6623207.1 ABC-type branched-subunit amino acid transport system ATPase component [Sinomonas atrocyanea]
MLELTGLTAGYGKTRVVDDVTLSIHSGEVTALLGRNGVGKTTLLRSIFGLCDVHQGRVRIDGTPVPPGRPEYLARRGFSYMPDDRGVFPTMTVEENLQLARRRGYEPPVDVYSLFPLLTERAGQPAGQLSGGQKQQVGIARSILAGEQLIAIDEFSQGLQPSLAQAALQTLREVAAAGKAVLFIEQGPALPLEYADRAIGMVKGRIVLDEPITALREDQSSLTELLVIS